MILFKAACESSKIPTSFTSVAKIDIIGCTASTLVNKALKCWKGYVQAIEGKIGVQKCVPFGDLNKMCAVGLGETSCAYCQEGTVLNTLKSMRCEALQGNPIKDCQQYLMGSS